MTYKADINDAPDSAFAYTPYTPNSGRIHITSLKSPVFWGAVEKFGYEKCLLMIADRDLNFMREVARLTKGAIEHVAGVFDLLMLMDDLGTDRGAIMSPADFRWSLRRSYTEIAAACHRAGARAVFHSCGDTAGLLPDIAACGFDIYRLDEAGDFCPTCIRAAIGLDAVLWFAPPGMKHITAETDPAKLAQEYRAIAKLAGGDKNVWLLYNREVGDLLGERERGIAIEAIRLAAS